MIEAEYELRRVVQGRTAQLAESLNTPNARIVIPLTAAESILSELDRLRARLEIDPSHPIDGIACRDETIRQQDQELDRLTRELAYEGRLRESTADQLVAVIRRAEAAEAERDAMKLQAQIHAQEARCANHSLAECYQAVTGSTGEPGNWNGAVPVREALESLRAERDALAQALLECATVEIRLGDKELSDAIGSHGMPYQSQWLADLLAQIENERTALAQAKDAEARG